VGKRYRGGGTCRWKRYRYVEYVGTEGGRGTTDRWKRNGRRKRALSMGPKKVPISRAQPYPTCPRN
jgi:hypothetical protein